MEGKKAMFLASYFKKGKDATEMQRKKKVCAMYGEGDAIDGLCQKWFVKLGAEYFSLDDAPQLGRPVEVDRDPIETLSENNQCYTTWEIDMSPWCRSAVVCKPTYPKHPNQEFRIICTSLVMLTVLMF